MLEYNTKYERKKVYWKYSSVCNIETLAVKQQPTKYVGTL